MGLLDRPEVLALGGALFAALGHVIAKRAVTVVPFVPLFLTLRWCSSLVVFSLIATVLGAWPGFRIAPELSYVLAGALTGPVLAWNLYVRAIARLDVSIAYPLTQTSALGSVALAYLFLGERPSLFVALGAALIVGGIFLLQRPGPRAGTRVSPVGVLLALGTAVCWSVNAVLWKLGVVYVGALESNWVRTAVPSLVMSASLLLDQNETRRAALRKALVPRTLLLAALVGLCADVMSFGLQFMALRTGDVSTVNPIVNSSPLFLVIFSTLWLGERLTRRALGGVAAIVTGVWLVAVLGRG